MKEQRAFEYGYYRLERNKKITVFDDEYILIDRFCFGQKAVRIDYTNYYEEENDGSAKCFLNNNFIFYKTDTSIIFDDDDIAKRFSLERKYVQVEIETENGMYDRGEYHRMGKEQIEKIENLNKGDLK